MEAEMVEEKQEVAKVETRHTNSRFDNVEYERWNETLRNKAKK